MSIEPTSEAPPAVVPAPSPAPSFVYALGQIEPRFPSLSLEKEFAQAVAGGDNAGLTDRQTLKKVMGERHHRYLARQLCWVFVVEGFDTYILIPRDPVDLELLVDAYRDEPRRDDLDVVIGVRGQNAPPELCNGLELPVVVFDLIYSFDRDTLIAEIPQPESVADSDRFRSAAGGLFDQLVQMADNAGATDGHRAMNYLAVRYPRVYALATEQLDRNFAFTGVEARPSALSQVRTLVDVIFSFRHRDTDVPERYSVRVDVTEEFPFLVSKLAPYYEI